MGDDVEVAAAEIGVGLGLSRAHRSNIRNIMTAVELEQGIKKCEKAGVPMFSLNSSIRRERYDSIRRRTYERQLKDIERLLGLDNVTCDDAAADSDDDVDADLPDFQTSDDDDLGYY